MSADEETNKSELNSVDDALKKQEYEKLIKDKELTDNLDILRDQKRSYTKEYSRLTNRFERALIEHKLAVEYYEFRSFYYSFLPLTLIASATTIIGFLLSGSNKYASPTQDNDGVQESTQFEPLLTGQSANMWSIVVGILGAISTLLTTIGKHTNYQSQYDMHQSAVKALEKICLTVDFEKDWFNRKADSDDFMNSAAKKRMKNPDAADQDALAALVGADLKSHQASFKAMQDACCDSPVPTRVIQSFTVLDQIDPSLGSSPDLIYFYHKLWKEYSMYPWWPLKAPNLNVIKKYNEWSTPADDTTTSRTPGYGSVDQREAGQGLLPTSVDINP